MAYSTYWTNREQQQPEDQLPSLSQLWAEKYVSNLARQDYKLNEIAAAQGRRATAQNLSAMLRSMSAQAWNKTEALLAREIRRHAISLDLIDPWTISKDVHCIYEKALAAYVNEVSPQRFSVTISQELGEIRRHHTAVDPRVIGFVSMQFHYCGSFLAQEAPAAETKTLREYFKVVDDLLYMPLHRAYAAAASYDFEDPRLRTIHQLLPQTSRIAQAIVNQVRTLYPHYECYSGPLDSEAVRTSSVRDVEMFQIYLWTCLLEKSIAPITQELFPLCVMLYPTLKVNWQLVRDMIELLGKAFAGHIEPELNQYYQPYYQALWQMFSPEVFPEAI